MLRITSRIVFACHQAACAPPPAGHGGSLPGPANQGKVRGSVPGAIHTKVKPPTRAPQESDVGQVRNVVNPVGDKHPRGVGWIQQRGTVESLGPGSRVTVRLVGSKRRIGAEIVS